MLTIRPVTRTRIGLERWFEFPFHQMPGMDGIAALRRLRAEPRTAALKVVAFTALAMTGDRERLIEEGFDGYLEKPIRYQEFLASVAALLEGRKE